MSVSLAKRGQVCARVSFFGEQLQRRKCLMREREAKVENLQNRRLIKHRSERLCWAKKQARRAMSCCRFGFYVRECVRVCVFRRLSVALSRAQLIAQLKETSLFLSFEKISKDCVAMVKVCVSLCMLRSD